MTSPADGATAAASEPTPAWGDAALAAAIADPRQAITVVRDSGSGAVGVVPAPVGAVLGRRDIELVGALPPLYPEWLGDRSFQETHGTRFAYAGGAMANGIASVAYVIELAKAGAIGFFGAAGLSAGRVEAAIGELKAALDPAGLPWGVNLIHSPAEPALEETLVDLFLKLLRASKRYRPEGRMMTFVYRCATNLWIDHYRQYWEGAFDRMDALITRLNEEAQKNGRQ